MKSDIIEYMPESRRLLSNGLTPKQQKFTNIVVKQIVETGTPNATQAALQTYDTKSISSAAVSGHENLMNPKIKATIQEALAQIGLTPNVIAKELKLLVSAKPKHITGDTKLRSIVELLKLTGSYPTQKHANISLSLKANLSKMKFEEIKNELGKIDEELKILMGNDDASKDPQALKSP